MVSGYNVHPTAQKLCVSGGNSGLVQPICVIVVNFTQLNTVNNIRIKRRER
jgi:hypothetical protein